MIDYLVCISGIFATISPFGALATVLAIRQDRTAKVNTRQLACLAPIAAYIVLSIGAVVSSPLLDLLDVSGPAFQFAAAAIMLPLAARLIIAGDDGASQFLSKRMRRKQLRLGYRFRLLATARSERIAHSNLDAAEARLL